MGKKACSHLAIERRRAIECGLNNRESLSSIARKIGFDVSTVRHVVDGEADAPVASHEIFEGGVSSEGAAAETADVEKWYMKMWLVVLLLVLFWPVGLFLM